MQHHHPAAAGQIRGGSQIRHRGVKAVFYLFKQQQRKNVAAQCCTSAQRHGMGGEIAAKWGEVLLCLPAVQRTLSAVSLPSPAPCLHESRHQDAPEILSAPSLRPHAAGWIGHACMHALRVVVGAQVHSVAFRSMLPICHNPAVLCHP